MQYEANWMSVIMGFCLAMGMVWLGSLSIEAKDVSLKVQKTGAQIASR